MIRRPSGSTHETVPPVASTTELIGKPVDESFMLIPPFYTTGGVDIRVGRNVFVNQNFTFYDFGELDIADGNPARVIRTIGD
jgi:acetyltransferase-like isoleucine patch superfamily enzyme